jgi:hypothetical protein
VRAGSNLSNFPRKSSAGTRRNSDRAILRAKCFITERDVANMSKLLREMRGLADRFDAMRWQMPHKGCRR